MAKRAGKSIGWADYVCNTVKGRCPADPPCEYCYMEGFFKRFKWNPEKRTGLNPELRLDLKELRWKPPAGSLVFCCSSLDLFHPAMWFDWIVETLHMVEHNPRAVYALLTKWPQEYEKFDGFPDNAWLGTTWDGLERTAENIWALRGIREIFGNLVWVSFEPLLSPPLPSNGVRLAAPGIDQRYIDWIVIGADSRPGAPKPPDEWADVLIDEAKTYDIPVWMKDNYGYLGKYGVLKERPEIEVHKVTKVQLK